ncbi:cytidylyltransferase domain-containing protein, partial [Lamprobacter modestohalophilus]|uniref:cytidylyltransferase domain-containing protein n=1 Tax=Lamprobacter modestohalophilus TaxID=1064514 RepID=UPI003D18EC74
MSITSNLCIIPARGGSKRIPRKNIRDFCGKPMIAWSIIAAPASAHAKPAAHQKPDWLVVDHYALDTTWVTIPAPGLRGTGCRWCDRLSWTPRGHWD